MVDFAYFGPLRALLGSLAGPEVNSCGDVMDGRFHAGLPLYILNLSVLKAFDCTLI